MHTKTNYKDKQRQKTTTDVHYMYTYVCLLGFTITFIAH